MRRLLSGLLKPIGRPLWRRLQSRVVMMIHNDAYLARRLENIDQAIGEMRLETNHVPVLERKVTALETQADAPILDFRLEQLRRDLEQKYAAEIYILKQAIYEA